MNERLPTRVDSDKELWVPLSSAIAARRLLGRKRLGALFFQGLHETVVGLIEFLHTLGFQLLGDFVDIDIQLPQSLKNFTCLIQTVLETGCRISMVPVGVKRVLRKRVDRFRSDQGFYILDVGLFRVLRARARP